MLTGAGISTASGIPDFRSRTGIWAKVGPTAVATIEAFDADPVATWGFSGPRYRMLAAATPNDAHRALAELERRGVVRAVITQNIEGSRVSKKSLKESTGCVENLFVVTTETLVNTLVSGGRLALEQPEDETVIHWRFDQLERAGYDELGALALAIDPYVDLHEACALIGQGCDQHVALDILL